MEARPRPGSVYGAPPSERWISSDASRQLLLSRRAFRSQRTFGACSACTRGSLSMWLI